MRSLIVRFSIVLCAPLASVATAQAEEPAKPDTEASASPEAEAKALFEQARLSFEKGDYAAACPLFEQSLERMPGVGTRFQLANCYEKQGKKARAHQLFLEVAEVTQEAGQMDRHDVADARAAALEPDLGSLSIEVPNESTSLTVLLGEEVISAAKLEREFFVDPADLRIVARQPGKAEWSKDITVAPGQVVTVKIPELEPEAPEAQPEPEPEPEAEPEPEPESEPVQEAEPPQHAYTWVPPVALGVGAVGLFAGLAFTQQYRSSNEDAKDVCPSSHGCTPEEIDRHAELLDDARTARTGAFIGYGVAIAGLAGGAIYYIVRPKTTSESALHRIRVSPAIGTDAVGGVAYGSF